MPAPSDLVHQTSTTTGTGALTLTAENGKRTFLTAFGTGGTDTFDYFVSNRDAAEWERGTGHENAGTLVRDTVIASSNANAAVNFSAGTKDVTNDIPAASQVHISLVQTLTNKDISSTTNTYRAASDTVTGALEIAVQSEMETGTDTTRAVVPGRQHFHPSAIKAWGVAGITGNVLASYNLTGVTDTATGRIVFTWDVDFSSANYPCAVDALDNASADQSTSMFAQAAGSVSVWHYRAGEADPQSWFAMATGDQ